MDRPRLKRNRSAAVVAVILATCLWSHAAHGMELKGAPRRAGQLVQDASEARQRGELSLASALLDEAAAIEDAPLGAIAMERGRVAVALERWEDAAIQFGRAAELLPRSDAAVEHGAVLVELGRWPEAVVVLRRAFDVRGGSLKVETVAADPRFSKLQAFAPFTALIKAVREEQAGPFAKLLIRLEDIDAQAKRVVANVDRANSVYERLLELVRAPWFSVVLLIALATLAALCFSQMRIAPAPWTLLLGLIVASGVWKLGAEAVGVSADLTDSTVSVVWIILVVPTVVAYLLRYVLRRRRPRLDERQLALASSVDSIRELIVAGQWEDALEASDELSAALKTAQNGVKPPVPPVQEESSEERG